MITKEKYIEETQRRTLTLIDRLLDRAVGMPPEEAASWLMEADDIYRILGMLYYQQMRPQQDGLSRAEEQMVMDCQLEALERWERGLPRAVA